MIVLAPAAEDEELPIQGIVESHLLRGIADTLAVQVDATLSNCPARFTFRFQEAGVRQQVDDARASAFEVLLGPPSSEQFNPSFRNRSERDESRDLRPGLDREAGA